MVVTKQDIREFCGNAYKRMLSRGENLFKSVKVLSVLYDVEYGMLTGRVEASMRKTTYKTWAKLKKNGSVEDAGCECVRGLSKCGHMIGLLMKASRTVSSTSVSCQWSKKKNVPEEDKACTVESLQKRKLRGPAYDVVDPALFEKLEANLKACPGAPGAGVLFLLAELPDLPPLNSSRPQIPLAKDVICSESTMNAEEIRSHVLQQLAVSWEEIVRIAASTTGQSANPEWLIVRSCRLTASHFGAVLRQMKKNGRSGLTESFLRSLFVHQNLDGVKAIQWGRTHEKVALAKFEEGSGVSVEPTGIWLHETGVLGASPDGLIGDKGVLEVKCPYSCRNAANLADAFPEEKLKKKPYIIFQEKGMWKLNPDHDYYHQVQAALYFTKRERGIFYIWIPKDFVAVVVEKDASWEGNIQILLSFYFGYFVRFVRSQSLSRSG